jgi:hypothetical protein
MNVKRAARLDRAVSISQKCEQQTSACVRGLIDPNGPDVEPQVALVTHLSVSSGGLIIVFQIQDRQSAKAAL